MPSQHWIVTVAQRAQLPNSERLAVAPGASVEEAWSEACRTCGVSPAVLSRHIAQQFRLRVADLDAAENRAIKLVPETVARRFGILPLRENDRQLVVATSDPVDLEVEQALGFASGRTPVFEVAPPEAIQRAIDTKYSPDRVVQSLLGNMAVGGGDSVQIVEEAEPEAIGAVELEAEPVVKLANLILSDAVRERASDVHIEPGRAGGTVRFRVDGCCAITCSCPCRRSIAWSRGSKSWGRWISRTGCGPRTGEPEPAWTTGRTICASPPCPPATRKRR
jgi:hypothetical protein